MENQNSYPYGGAPVNNGDPYGQNYQVPPYYGPNYQQPGYGYNYAPPQPPFPAYAIRDPGEDEAKNCKVFGILSLFLLPLIFAIISLVYAGNYSTKGNGQHSGDVSTGRTCAIISLILQGLGIIGAIIWLIVVGSFAAIF